MKTRACLVLVLICGLLPMLRAAATVPPRELRSPELQVFQFVQRGTYTYLPEDIVKTAAYLWIPEKCQRLRGLLILCENVPEHGLVEHPAIRAACAANDLGIVWCTPTFISVKKRDEAPKTVAFLQELLDGLAKQSGYPEVATVPWLPMGESFHLVMVYQLLNQSPERCLAGIFIKNSMSLTSCTNRETPVLITVGTSQEWFQDQADIRTKWQNVAFYNGLMKEHAAHPNWPVSIMVDGHSGHFDCTESMTEHFAAYIEAVVKARLPKNPGEPLRPVQSASGYVANLPLVGQEAFEPIAAAKARPEQRAAAWYFNEALARDAFKTASINWHAQTQFLTFLDAQGQPVPMIYKGVTNPVPMDTGEDGITFEIKGGQLPAIPKGFVGAGDPLATPPGETTVEWQCGSAVPLGQGKFRVELGRTYPQGLNCIVLRHPGTPEVRTAVEPGLISLTPRKEGAPQTITFEPLADRPAGSTPVKLVASASSGMPVRFFVVAGPAVVEDGVLHFTAIPPRTHFPIEVTVTAWQWGRAIEPKVQTAKLVTQTFRITAANSAALTSVK